MINKDDSVMKYKQLMMIHEPPVEFKQNLSGALNREISCCCCIAKGSCMLNCNFNKNVFYNNEIAECNYTFDNSKGNMDVKEIEFELQQHVLIMAK